MNIQLGHNNPPIDIEEIQPRLADQYGDLITRTEELLGSVDRMPKEITDKEVAGKVGDLAKQITACMKKAEANRKDEKEPYLSAGRSVDGWFKNSVLDPLTKAKKQIDKVLTPYLQKVAAEERKRQEEEAERLRKQAEAEAAKAESLDDLEAAFEAEKQAEKVQKQAEAKPAEHARTRGEMGSVATLQTRWVGEIIDPKALDLEALRDHIPRDALQKAVNSYVKAGNRTLKGARIFEQSTARVS